jgi:glycosyltransferase involved in cell wall biosynthesis
MKKVIAAPGLFKDFGGPRKTIGTFSKALDAPIYSFCDGVRICNESLAVDNAVPVASSTIPILRQFLVPQKKVIKSAETVVSTSGLVSCHMFYRYYSLWVNQMHRKHGTPYWFVPHGILDPWVMTKGALVKNAYWKFGGARFLEEAATVIFATEAERDKAAAHFDIPEAEVLPWPVEMVDVSGCDAARSKVREHLGIPEDAHVLLYFGRIHPMKQPLETIQAVHESKCNDVHLIIVGNEDGVSLDECSTLANELGVRPRIHLVGPIYGDAKYDYLFAADAYISLSHRENFNHTAAESLAAGLPVILSPGNDLLSELKDVSCYWTMESNSSLSASAAIKVFANTSKAKIKEMGVAGRSWVEGTLSFERFSSKLNALAQRYSR